MDGKKNKQVRESLQLADLNMTSQISNSGRNQQQLELAYQAMLKV